jgi:hypothetical protein
MEVFKLVFEEHQDGSKTAVRDNCIVLAATEFEYVVSLLVPGFLSTRSRQLLIVTGMFSALQKIRSP